MPLHQHILQPANAATACWRSPFACATHPPVGVGLPLQPLQFLGWQEQVFIPQVLPVLLHS
ncbi:MAG: hypothetical protein RMJ85_13845, partial [Anaerolineales bacterium]|nr:hypothetical protein [Anaerolineales bacterium]